MEQVQQPVDLLAGLLHAAIGAAPAEVGRDEPADVQRGREQAVDDGELVVSLVLGVGVDDNAATGHDRHRNSSGVISIQSGISIHFVREVNVCELSITCAIGYR
jgi:hypothetical protein